MEDFAAILVAARERLGITQAQLATAAGLTPSYLSLLENRKKPPPSDRVCERLATVLGIPARQLLDVAHLQRSPTTVQRRVRTLRGKLSRERKSRQRALESLLSPFLFPSTPSWIEGALQWLGGNPIRRRRLREVLAALGRKHQDRATAVSRLVDELPEGDRRLLLEALPRILGGGGRARTPPAPELFYSLPPADVAPKVPYLLAWTGPKGSLGEIRDGDHLLVDPTLEPRGGDLVLLRGPDGAPLARRVIRSNGGLRLVPVEGGAAGATAPGVSEEGGERLARDGAGVVVEIRRPIRRDPAS
jgi:transcriptional regulator with XRE-family HTH domain